MSDRLTQLQLCLDQMLDICFAGLSYVESHHAVVPTSDGDPLMTDPDHAQDSPEVFQDALEELSRDLVIKAKQILTTVDTLPGVGVSEQEQLETIQRLKQELIDAEQKRNEAIDKKELLLDRVNELILDVSKDYSLSK